MDKNLIKNKESPGEWIEEWFDLWPRGIKSGGYYVRTDMGSCLLKMNKFCLKYPEYTKSIIFVATKNYIQDRSRRNYAYMKLAPYFIEKDGTSMLEGFCLNVLESVNKTDIRNDMDDI